MQEAAKNLLLVLVALFPIACDTTSSYVIDFRCALDFGEGQVKMVVASAVNEQGEELYPRKWNAEFIDMPAVSKQQQRRPTLTGDVVTAILAVTKKQKYFIFFALCASAGLRFGEALGIDIKNISSDCSTIAIRQKAWRRQIHNFLKTKNGKREIDLHPKVSAMLKMFIGNRKSGLLFASRNGTPLQQSNILRRTLHPILVKIGQPNCGVHAFRRFRNTYLKNRTSCPEGVRQFHCNCLILGEVARPERFELPAFWFVGRPAKTSKCRYWYRLRAKRATNSAFNWAENLEVNPKVAQLF